MSDPAPDDEPGYELVMPFVVCRSAGGEYDDVPFCAGFECGGIDARLQYEQPPILETTVLAANVPQFDLIAMKHGYKLETAETEYDEWAHVTFTKTEDPAR